MMPNTSRLVLCAFFALLIAGAGFFAFAVSIHDPGVAVDMIQWVALPFFALGIALGLVQSDTLVWFTVFASWVFWSFVLFKLLPHQSPVAARGSSGGK